MAARSRLKTSDYFTLDQVLEQLFRDDHPDQVCHIAVIPLPEVDAVESDCDSDASDMDYEGQTQHLPSRLLNAHAEFMNVREWDDLPFTLPLSPNQPGPSTPGLPSPVQPGPSTSGQADEGQPEEQRGQLDDSGTSSQSRGQQNDQMGPPETPRPTRQGRQSGNPDDTRDQPDTPRTRSKRGQPDDERGQPDTPRTTRSTRGKPDDERGQPDTPRTTRSTRGQPDDESAQPDTPRTTRSARGQPDDKRGQPDTPRSTRRKRGQPDDESAQPETPRATKPQLVAVKNKERVFTHSKKPAQVAIPEHVVFKPDAADFVKASSPEPMDVFLMMYPPTLREITLEMSNLYSMQTKGKHLNLSMDELLTFYGTLITSGYSTVPRRHMFWSTDSDVHNESISNAIRRRRFDEIMASVHVVDNTKITEDPFFKVRPIFSELNESYKVLPFTDWLSVDESMIPYYGRHGCKQFIRGKPIRFGYKLWSLASSGGYMYHMEPYAGSHTLLLETGLGQGPSVVLGLAEQASVPQGCRFQHDNLFTSLSLLDEMTKRGYGSSGTMRQNRLFGVPFTPQKDFMKLPRGSSEVLCQGQKLLVRWKDNSCVTLATNMEEKYTETTTRRWNREKRTFDQVPQPTCISLYNKHMGGVDLHDQKVSRYHVSIRSKKWWWPIFAWSLNSALVNSHLFYRDVLGGTIDQLTFVRQVAQSLLQRFGTRPLGHGNRSLLAAAVRQQAIADSTAHWPINTGHRYRRCLRCGNRTTYACEKCDAPLHIECFKLYHGV